MREIKLRNLLIKLAVLFVLGMMLARSTIIWTLVLKGQPHDRLSGARLVDNITGGTYDAI